MFRRVEFQERTSDGFKDDFPREEKERNSVLSFYNRPYLSYATRNNFVITWRYKLCRNSTSFTDDAYLRSFVL